MKKFIFLLLFLVLLTLAFRAKPTMGEKAENFWEFQSIDTMKYSRDIAREKLHEYSFDTVIASQVQSIARTGVTHVALATPYDEEFIPYLRRWVREARKNNIHVWYRGNWSGWEQWFDYPKISREEHIEKTYTFITTHPDLFENGDVFSACPECENGGPGDPRMNGDAKGYREFLIKEYETTKKAFEKINKRVQSNYASMNGDVARLVMDKETTKAMDGLVVIDHYVKDPQKLVSDIREISQKSGGRVVLGEFGAPILDIHGAMTQEEQANWIDQALLKLTDEPSFIGVNYWVSTGGSTEIFPSSSNPRLAVQSLTKYFLPKIVSGHIVNEIGEPLKDVHIETPYRRIQTSNTGEFRIPYIREQEIATVSGDKLVRKEVSVRDLKEGTLSLRYVQESFVFKIKRMLFSFLNAFHLR